MKWRKMGRIYAPDGRQEWATNSALQPTPYLVDDDRIRVYVGFRDTLGVSRVGFVDVEADDPAHILRVSEKPVLDIGVPGAFDDNGVVPCAAVARDGKIFLYYAGYQLATKIRFTVFGGLAISEDGGESFVRHSQVPVLDRVDGELFFRVAHSVLPGKDGWRIWYGGGSNWVMGSGKQLPVYDVRYLESPDGITFPHPGIACITFADAEEYRIGRPYVTLDGQLYRMFYGMATKSEGYRLGYAESGDGKNWMRKDGEVGITVSQEGWDSTMIAYPAVVKYADKTYLFYNGNDMGATGFGYALLEER